MGNLMFELTVSTAIDKAGKNKGYTFSLGEWQPSPRKLSEGKFVICDGFQFQTQSCLIKPTVKEVADLLVGLPTVLEKLAREYWDGSASKQHSNNHSVPMLPNMPIACRDLYLRDKEYDSYYVWYDSEWCGVHYPPLTNGTHVGDIYGVSLYIVHPKERLNVDVLELIRMTLKEFHFWDEPWFGHLVDLEG